MAKTTLTGKKAMLFIGDPGALVDTAIALDPNEKYVIESIADTGSGLPSINGVGGVFITPDTSETPITLVLGDSVRLLGSERNCKVAANVSFAEGSIDVTTDCDDGVVMVPDGYVAITGDISSFMQIDKETGILTTNGIDILSKFISITGDDGAGVYSFTPRENDTVWLQILLNEDAAVGEVQNWLFVPVFFTSLATGAGLKESTKLDASWVQAEGSPSVYNRTVKSAADLPGA